MQILEGGADDIKGCFLAVAVMPSNSCYLNIFFFRVYLPPLTCHCNLLLK